MSVVIEQYINDSLFSKLEEETIITGKVTEIREREVIVDIGAKAEGEIPVHEFLDIGEIQIGSDIEVFLEKLENKNVIIFPPDGKVLKNSKQHLIAFDILKERIQNYYNNSKEHKQGCVIVTDYVTKKLSLIHI